MQRSNWKEKSKWNDMMGSRVNKLRVKRALNKSGSCPTKEKVQREKRKDIGMHIWFCSLGSPPIFLNHTYLFFFLLTFSPKFTIAKVESHHLKANLLSFHYLEVPVITKHYESELKTKVFFCFFFTAQILWPILQKKNNKLISSKF